MTARNLFRLSGLTAMVFGGLRLVSPVLVAAGVITATTDGYRVLVAIPFYVLALMGIYAQQHEKAGVLGLVGFAVAVTGDMLNIGLRFVTVLVAPYIQQFPEAVAAAGQGPFTTAMMVTFWLYVIGYVLLGVSIAWAGVLPRIAGVLLALGAVVSFVLAALPVNIGAMLVGAGMVWLGYALWMGNSERVASPVPEMAATD